MINMALPVTIQDLIDAYRKQEKTYKNLHEKAIITDSNGDTIRVPYGSLINKYKDYLAGSVVTANLTDDEVLYYKYKPRLIAKNIYGSAELWFMILELNYMCSVTEFKDISSLRLYHPSLFVDMINEIMIMEGIL
jgi:hypothetical protein